MKCSVLDDKKIGLIHRTSIGILGTVGIVIPHKEMRNLFRAAGAVVDDAAECVKIPEKLVMSSLATAGKKFTLYGRDLARTAVFGEGKRNYNATAGEALWIDDHTGERRYTTIDDVRAAARLGNSLPDLNIVGAMADPKDIPTSYRCVEVAAEMLKLTTKPITFWFHDRASAKFLIDLFAAVRGSVEEVARHPFAYPFLEPISPLRFPANGIDLLFETCKVPLPVPIGPMAQVGLTAPGTLAGTLALENAEILAGVCVTQLIRPGTPVCYGGIPHAYDMRTTQMVFAGPEQALMAVAMTQMGKHYGLPVYINVGLTDSKTVDAQAGIEAGITLATGAMAGADIFGHLGICGVDLGTSLTMLAMQHEVIGYVERMMRDFEVSEETLGLDVIRSVGPGGNFIAEEHTAEHFRKELFFPKLLNREFWDPWVADGRRDLRAKALDMVDGVLATHQPVPMDDGMAKRVDGVVADAKRILGS
jgi:trimethylamine--corrinoid protein Co-methyltransferase